MLSTKGTNFYSVLYIEDSHFYSVLSAEDSIFYSIVLECIFFLCYLLKIAFVILLSTEDWIFSFHSSSVLATEDSNLFHAIYLR